MPTGGSNSAEAILCVLPMCFSQEIITSKTIGETLSDFKQDLIDVLEEVAVNREIKVVIAGDTLHKDYQDNHYTEVWVPELLSVDSIIKQDDSIKYMGYLESTFAYAQFAAGKRVKIYNMSGFMNDEYNLSFDDLCFLPSKEGGAKVKGFKVVNSLVNAVHFVNEFEKIEEAPSICICLGEIPNKQEPSTEYYLSKDVSAIIEKYSETKYISCLIVSCEVKSDTADAVKGELQNSYPDVMAKMLPLIDKTACFLASIENEVNYPPVVFLGK